VQYSSLQGKEKGEEKRRPGTVMGSKPKREEENSVTIQLLCNRSAAAAVLLCSRLPARKWEGERRPETEVSKKRNRKPAMPCHGMIWRGTDSQLAAMQKAKALWIHEGTKAHLDWT